MKGDLYHEYPRLAELMDRLCDVGLEQAEADELSQIVTSDARACEFYVLYMDLHASLQWDLALPADQAVLAPSLLETEDAATLLDQASAETPPALRALMQGLLEEARGSGSDRLLAAAAELNGAVEHASLNGPQTIVPERQGFSLASGRYRSPEDRQAHTQRSGLPLWASRLRDWRVATPLLSLLLVVGLIGLGIPGWWRGSETFLADQNHSAENHSTTRESLADLSGSDSNSTPDSTRVGGVTSETATPGGLAQRDAESQSPPLPPVLPDLDWGKSREREAPRSSPRQSPPGSTGVAEKSTPPENLVAKQDRRLLTDDEVIEAIDHVIARGWEDSQLTPSTRAEDHEWVRRVYLDLAGRIPTADEVWSFVSSSQPDKDRRLVDELLAGPEFSLQWSTRWTNLLVGRSPNEQVDRIALQRYLRNAVDEGYGWSLVVRDLIAAEGDPREQGAANFLVAHLNNQAVPATAFVARTLMGTQIHCAQCHKHPFYEVSQQEFWELNSFFKQAAVVRGNSSMNGPAAERRSVPTLVDRPVGGPTYFETRAGVMRVAYPKFQGREVDPSPEVSRRAELAQLLTEGDAPVVARAFVNRTWSQIFGYGFTAPVDDLGPHNPPTHPELFSALTESFVQHGYDIKRLIRWLCLSQPYRLSSQMNSGNQADRPDNGELPGFSRMYFKPLSAEQLFDSLLVIKGENPSPRRDWQAHVLRREQWVGQFISSLQNDENDEESQFDGSIGQALVLMNGALVAETVSPRSNPLLRTLLAAPLSDVEKLERLSLAVLSRRPHPEELTLFRKLNRSLKDARSPAERDAQLAARLEDFLWAYLNSSEFIMNH